MTSFCLESIPNKNFNYLYLDRRGKLGFDQDDSFLGIVTRAFASLLGLRDYDLTHVFPVAQQTLGEREIELLTGKLARSVGLTSGEFENIQKLSRYYFNPKQHYSPQELLELKTFIESVKSNLRLNSAVNQLIGMQTTLDKVHVRALKALRTFSFETTKVGKLTDAFKKVEDLQSKLQKGGTLNAEMKEKLSLAEMHELESVIQLAPVFRDFKKMGLTFQRSSEIGSIRRNINIADNTLRRIQNIIRRENPPALVNFIFYDNPNAVCLRTPLIHFLSTWIFRLGLKADIFHASISYRDNQKQETEAHMAQQFIKEKRSLYSQSFKTFALDGEKLFEQYPKETRVQLEAFYGKNWKAILTQKFGRVLNDYFDHTQSLNSFHNPILRRFLGAVGLQSLFREGGFFNQMQFSKTKRSICTEFVMKSLMQCYAQLEGEIRKDWDKASSRRTIDTLPPQLPKPTSDSMACALSPPSMTRSLMDSGLVHEVKRPNILGQILDYHHYDIKDGLNYPLFG